MNTIREYEILGIRRFNSGEYAAMIVAIKGHANDWAAYAGGFPIFMKDEEAAQLIASNGSKLTEEQALVFFPGGFIKRDARDPIQVAIQLTYRR